jgi:hypothetical protein
MISVERKDEEKREQCTLYENMPRHQAASRLATDRGANVER